MNDDLREQGYYRLSELAEYLKISARSLAPYLHHHRSELNIIRRGHVNYYLLDEVLRLREIPPGWVAVSSLPERTGISRKALLGRIETREIETRVFGHVKYIQEADVPWLLQEQPKRPAIAILEQEYIPIRRAAERFGVTRQAITGQIERHHIPSRTREGKQHPIYVHLPTLQQFMGKKS